MENNFSSNLKHLRIQAGLTQEELAKKLDKDYSTIGKWELGQRSPIMVDVIKISELFNIPLEDLIGKSYTETIKPLSKTDILYNKTKDILSDDDRATIESIMNRTIEKYEKSKNQEE